MPKDIIVFDLDGTLSDGTHRLGLLPTKGLDIASSWDAFNLAAGGDEVFANNRELMNTLYHTGHYKIIILTGRSDVARDITVSWLSMHGCQYHKLIMRKSDDNRADIDFKEAALKFLGVNNILCAFDDLEHVAKHLRTIGVTCHLVTHYDEKQVHTQPQVNEVVK